MAASEIGDRLRSAWLQQLQREYDNICFQYRLTLQAPVFELTNSSMILGSWNGSYRLLSLSAHLIAASPWAVTIQVLKHEMAHQICWEYFSSNDGGHGKYFQQACAMVGLSGDFCRAKADCSGSPPEEAACAGPQTEQGRKVLARVEKLLALAASDNEHEAALAMQRAGEILLRYNLQLPTSGQEEYEHRCLNTGRRRMPGHLREICALLQDFFPVRVVCGSTYEPLGDVQVRTIELLGRPENVAVAEHCYIFLTRKMDVLWQENRKQFAGGGLRARNSYFHGLLAGFREKLKASALPQGKGTAFGAQESSSAQLIVQSDNGLDAFVNATFPRLHKKRGRTRNLHGEAYRKALATGRLLVLHRVVEGVAAEGGLLGSG